MGEKGVMQRGNQIPGEKKAPGKEKKKERNPLNPKKNIVNRNKGKVVKRHPGKTNEMVGGEVSGTESGKERVEKKHGVESRGIGDVK